MSTNESASRERTYIVNQTKYLLHHRRCRNGSVQTTVTKCEAAAFTILVILPYFYAGWRPTVRPPRCTFIFVILLFLLISVTRFRARFVLFKLVINEFN